MICPFCSDTPYALASHPNGATSYVFNSPWGASRTRREAKADAEAEPSYYGNGYGGFGSYGNG